MGKITVSLLDESLGEAISQDEIAFAVKLVAQVSECDSSSASIEFIDASSFETEYEIDLTSTESTAKVVEIAWPDIEVKDLGAGCVTTRETELTLDGSEEEWITKTDMDTRKITIDPTSDALQKVEGNHQVFGTLREAVIDKSSKEVLLENSFTFEIKLIGKQLDAFAGVLIGNEEAKSLQS